MFSLPFFLSILLINYTVKKNIKNIYEISKSENNNNNLFYNRTLNLQNKIKIELNMHLKKFTEA